MTASTYAAAKDFAGPVATMIAAATAAFVTIRIQRQNQQLARDRLKLDLFARRYEVYRATLDLLLLLTHNPNLEEAGVNAELGRIYAKMAEAPFSCGSRAQAFVDEVRAIDSRWRAGKSRASLAHMMPPGPEKIEAALAPSKASMEVLEAQNRIAGAFVDDLRIWPASKRKRVSLWEPRR